MKLISNKVQVGNKKWKDALYPYVIQEVQIKTTWNIIAHLLKSLKSGILTRGCYSSKNSHLWLVRMQKAWPLWTAVKCLFVLLINIFFPYDPAIMLLGIYPKDLKTYVHTERLHTVIYSNFMNNFPNLKATKIFFSRLMDK